MADLDDLAGTGTYFARGAFRLRNTWKHIMAAVELFGGDVSVSLPSDGRY